MRVDDDVQGSEREYVLTGEDEAFLKETVARNRVEHHGRLSYMDILFELEQRFGHCIPAPVLDRTAYLVGTSPAQLNGFITFYTMLSTRPRGRHIIRVCTSGPCHVSGAPAIMAELEKILGVGLGETTPDGVFTLEGSSCLGICGVSPALMIDESAYGNLEPEDLADILESHRKEDAR